MSNDNSSSLPELNDRIAVLRDNIRQLAEQAAASSGAQDEERTSERIAQQQEELEKLVKQRDAMLKRSEESRTPRMLPQSLMDFYLSISGLIDNHRLSPGGQNHSHSIVLGDHDALISSANFSPHDEEPCRRSVRNLRY